jgi:hypothetical protein
VLRGTRPSRPVDDRARVRGLDDGIWSIIESCWAPVGSARPSTHQIVERLRASPNRTVDERPLDTFDSSFRSRTLYSEAEHPFSYLPGVTNDTLAN